MVIYVWFFWICGNDLELFTPKTWMVQVPKNGLHKSRVILVPLGALCLTIAAINGHYWTIYPVVN